MIQKIALIFIKNQNEIMQLHCEYTEFFSMDWENTQLIMIILVSGKDERVMGLRVEDTNTFNLYPYYFIFFKK